MAIDVEQEFPGPFMHLGTVVYRNDPEGLYRIKAKIPGRALETDWAFPFGFAAGAKRGGGPHVPPVGSRVLVVWEGGDINNSVYYTPVGFSRGQPPTGTVIHDADGKDNFVWQNDRMRVEIDSRDNSAGLRVTDLDESGGTDQAGTAVSLELDFATGQAEIASTLGLKLRATGAVEIQGGSVTINGRLVAPGSKPI